MDAKMRHWAFLIGVALAIIAGFVPELKIPTVSWILVLLGLIVGLLNITSKEVQEFLIAAVTLVIAANAASAVNLGMTMTAVLENVVKFVFPAAFVVALKAVWQLASD